MSGASHLIASWRTAAERGGRIGENPEQQPKDGEIKSGDVRPGRLVVFQWVASRTRDARLCAYIAAHFAFPRSQCVLRDVRCHGHERRKRISRPPWPHPLEQGATGSRPFIAQALAAAQRAGGIGVLLGQHRSRQSLALRAWQRATVQANRLDSRAALRGVAARALP